eukprot:3832155-Pleurochrysis_carterae.AAC.2
MSRTLLAPRIGQTQPIPRFQAALSAASPRTTMLSPTMTFGSTVALRVTAACRAFSPSLADLSSTSYCSFCGRAADTTASCRLES